MLCRSMRRSANGDSVSLRVAATSRRRASGDLLRGVQQRGLLSSTVTLLALRGARGAGRQMAEGGPSEGGATSQSQAGNFDTSFEKLVNNITEKMPFQVAQGNAYDVQFGEEGYQTRVEREHKEAANKADPDSPKEKLRKRLTGEDVMTPESVGADRTQSAVKERRREKYDKSILKRSVEKPEFYYPEMTLGQKRLRGLGVICTYLAAMLVCYIIYVISFFDDTSCEPPTKVLPDGVSGTYTAGEQKSKDYFPEATGIKAVFSQHLHNDKFQSHWN